MEDEVKKALNEKRFDDAVFELVRSREHVSFAEIQHMLEGHMEVAGNVALVRSEYPNIIFWIGSAEFVDLIRRLTGTERIYRHPSSLSVYAIDGHILQLPVRPVRKSVRALKSKKNYWDPIVFCTYSPHGKKPRKNARKAKR